MNKKDYYTQADAIVKEEIDHMCELIVNTSNTILDENSTREEIADAFKEYAQKSLLVINLVYDYATVDQPRRSSKKNRGKKS